jgi:hypothetical protein
MPGNTPSSNKETGITSHSIEQRKLIGQAIIDGILSPKHAALLSPTADYSQNGGNYTQKGGDYRQNGGGNYNQSKEMLPSLASIQELISRGQFQR